MAGAWGASAGPLGGSVVGTLSVTGAMSADSVAASSTLKVPVLADSTRGAAGIAGRVIFNTDDGQLNIDDGTNWTLPDGTTT